MKWLSVAEAAEVLGISQEKIYSDIRSGRTQAIENPRGRKYKVIDVEELKHCYGDFDLPTDYYINDQEERQGFIDARIQEELANLRREKHRLTNDVKKLERNLSTSLDTQNVLIYQLQQLTQSNKILTQIIAVEKGIPIEDIIEQVNLKSDNDVD